MKLEANEQMPLVMIGTANPLCLVEVSVEERRIRLMITMPRDAGPNSCSSISSGKESFDIFCLIKRRYGRQRTG